MSPVLALIPEKKSNRLGTPQNITSSSVMRTPPTEEGKAEHPLDLLYL